MCARGSPVGSTCCGYAGRHTTCREYCQAIFRTDSTPTVSQINAVKEYCQSHSAQLLSCVSNFTKSYPIRSPIDSKSHPYVLELTFTPHKFTEGYIVRMYFGGPGSWNDKFQRLPISTLLSILVLQNI